MAIEKTSSRDEEEEIEGDTMYLGCSGANYGLFSLT